MEEVKKDNSLYAAIAALVPSFFPVKTRNYTIRYVFFRKEDRQACFSVVTGLWDLHEKTFENLTTDENIAECFCEYVCEFDSDFAGAYIKLKGGEPREKVQE